MSGFFLKDGRLLSLLLGLGLFLSPHPESIKRYLMVGFFLGLAFLARYQTGFMLLGLGLWMIFIHRIKPFNLSLIFIAGSFTLLLSAGFDWWLYEQPTISSWEYFKWHAGMTPDSSIHVAHHDPWWFYIQYSTLQLLPPLTLLLPISVIAFWVIFPKHPITWLTLPFVFFHHYFGHKEVRFLFPVLPFVPVMFAMVFIKATNKFNLLNNKPFKYTWRSIFGFSVFTNVILVLLVLSLPASKEVALWQNCLSPLSTKKDLVLMIMDEDGSYADPAELNLDFYNTNNLIITTVKDETGIPDVLGLYSDKHFLYAVRKKDRSPQLDEAGISHKLICQALPDWILKININDWTSRTSMWRIWSIIKH